MPKANIKTTRSELLRLKKRDKLAQKGHKLLKEKRDALIAEFFKMADELKVVRKEVEDKLQEAYKSLILVQALQGVTEVEIAANAAPDTSNVSVDVRSVMGVKVPRYVLEEITSDRTYSFMSNSLELDTAVEKFREALRAVVQLAEIEAAVIKIAEDVKKTKRKVNALEQRIIPSIKSDIRYIKGSLEEMERESFTRLKSIKGKMEA